MTRREQDNQGIETIVQAAREADVLTAEEERRAARRAQQGDARACDRLVRAHLRLVLAIARQFRSYGTTTEDLVSEGVLGLVKAVRCFDPDRGVRLASYATFWIRAYMRRYTIENRRIVRAPSSRAGRKVLAGLRRTERQLGQIGGEPPDAAAVAHRLGVSVEDVEEMRTALAARDVPLGAEVAGRPMEIASDAASPEAIAIERQQERLGRELLQRALSGLPARSRRIVELRNTSTQAASLAELSDELGISRERVRQIEAQAKQQMRAAIGRAGACLELGAA